MLIISGRMRVGEAQSTLAAIRMRLRGPTWAYRVVMMACMLIGAGAALASLAPFSGQIAREMLGIMVLLVAYLGVTIGRFAYAFLCRRMVVAWFSRRMTARGLETDFPVTLTLNKTSMVQTSGPVVSTAQWPAVTEVFRSKSYWVFLVQMQPWFAPSRFFPDTAAEKAFIGQALVHMTPEARERSPEAVRFARP